MVLIYPSDSQCQTVRKTDITNDAEPSANAYRVERLERLDDNLFVIYTSARVRRIAVISRNMIVMRHNKRQLTLVNPIRLDDAGERQLLKLGQIVRIIRLAPQHGMSHDQYYLSKFPQVRRWAPERSPEPSIPVHRVLTEDDSAILPACHVFCFRETAQPECALLLLQDYVGNLLVTAEALQANRENPYINVVVRAKLASQGMMQSTLVIPPPWRRANTVSATSVLTNTNDDLLNKDRPQRRKAPLLADFERLLRLDFERCLGASGVMVYQQAKEQAVLAVEQGFPPAWE